MSARVERMVALSITGSNVYRPIVDIQVSNKSFAKVSSLSGCSVIFIYILAAPPGSIAYLKNVSTKYLVFVWLIIACLLLNLLNK